MCSSDLTPVSGGDELSAEVDGPGIAPLPGDLVDVAVSAGEFPTLIAAVQAAGLVDTLKSEGPFTVFAPTEAAFAAALEAL